MLTYGFKVSASAAIEVGSTVNQKSVIQFDILRMRACVNNFATDNGRSHCATQIFDISAWLRSAIVSHSVLS